MTGMKKISEKVIPHSGWDNKRLLFIEECVGKGRRLPSAASLKKELKTGPVVSDCLQFFCGSGFCFSLLSSCSAQLFGM